MLEAGLRAVGPLKMRPEEQAATVGMRVATDPECLLLALAQAPDRPSAAGRRWLVAFLRRFESVLAPVWAELRSRPLEPSMAGGTPVRRILREVLGR